MNTIYNLNIQRIERNIGKCKKVRLKDPWKYLLRFSGRLLTHLLLRHWFSDCN